MPPKPSTSPRPKSNRRNRGHSNPTLGEDPCYPGPDEYNDGFSDRVPVGDSRSQPAQKSHIPDPTSESATIFPNANNFVLDHPQFTQKVNHVNNHFNSGKAGLDHLLPYVCSGAAVDSSERDPPPLCHSGTREGIRGRLAAWFGGPKRRRKIIWLTGPAGTGKSAVAQTFAEFCVDNNRLGAAFFFSRSNERDKPITVIPTIAYQLAVHFPDYRRLLTDRIAYDPTILQKTARAQFKRLIIEPFSTLQVRGHPITQAPLLVLLDGLDECQGIPAQCEFVEMIGEVVRLKKDLPLLWLICSRPEPHLKQIFSRPDYGIDCLREELLIDAKTRDDVDLYLRDGFAKLRDDFRDVLSPSWPSSTQFDKVSEIVSGLFVLASTIMKYLGDPVYANPLARLATLLEFMRNAHQLGARNPFEALDLLYSNILADIPHDVLPMTKKILAHHLALRSSPLGTFPVRTFCNFLNIHRGSFYAALRKLHSIVDVPPPEDDYEGHLRFYHASFEDYLTNPIRSGKFAIDLSQAQTEIVNSCPFSYKIDEVNTDSPKTFAQTSEQGIIHLLQTQVLHSEDSYKTLLEATGADAQRILNILQMLLSSRLVGNTVRQPILMAFLQLSLASGLFPQQLELRDIEQLSKVLAGGRLADIYRGEHRGRQICVKMTKAYRKSNPNHVFNKIFRKAVLWSQLAHSNVLPFNGIYHIHNTHRIGLVSPWMANGNLSDYLKTHPDVLRLPLAYDVSAGLQYLHQHRITHGNLQGTNILIKDDGSACLADFAASSMVDPNVLKWFPQQGGGAVRWHVREGFTDPEDGPLHQKFSSDIYALAWVMLEIFTGKSLLNYLHDQGIVRKKLQGIMPDRPSSETAPELTDDVWEIMMNCWSRNASDRPTADRIIELLPEHLPSPATSTQEWVWRPSFLWTIAEMNSDKRFLMNFLNLD